MTAGFRSAILSILFFFICLFLFVRFAGPISINSVQTTKSDFFTVNGTGEVAAIATNAHFSVGVTAKGATETEAKNQMNTVMNKVTADLKALGILDKDIKTSNFSVYPNPEERPITLQGSAHSAVAGQALPVQQTSTSGFTATQNLEVTASSIDLANKALDAATNDGANQVSGVSFTFDDATQKDLHNQARKKAIADAKKNAAELANEAGITLGRVVNITENGGIQPMAAQSMALGKDANTATNLQPGENNISVTVTLSYETK